MKSIILSLCSFAFLLTVYSQQSTTTNNQSGTTIKSSGNQSVHQSTRPASATSQHQTLAPKKINAPQNSTVRSTKGNRVVNQSAVQNSSSNGVSASQTITEKRLNGGSNSSNQSTSPGNSNGTGTTQNNPFVGGIHPADNAAQKFENVDPANPNNTTNRNTASATIAGGNDSAVNVNTLTENGLPTNSGAVDKSGQSQFGQTNWGGNRGTVGESQWTVPPPITSSFNKDFPTISNATWTRSNLDTSIYSARYQSGAMWVTTNYNATGQQLDIRSEYPLTAAPAAVQNYLARQPAAFKAASIYKVQMQGRPDMYQVQSSGGQTVYLNLEGVEVRQ